jgi:hypothetical protein
MINVYLSKFARHDFDPKTQTVFSEWYAATQEMTREDFKNEMRAWLDVFRKHCPKRLYDDCVNFSYTISPEEQEWMAKLLNPEWVALGLKKYAHMVPEEMISSLAVEQLFDEFFRQNLSGQYPIRNFSSREEALAWLFDNR